jgi:hypothetical protein
MLGNQKVAKFFNPWDISFSTPISCRSWHTFCNIICETKNTRVMTQKEKFSLLTAEDLKKINDTIYDLSGGSVWVKMNSRFWEDVLNALLKEK